MERSNDAKQAHTDRTINALNFSAAVRGARRGF
jgi:hypothetical protein